MQRIQVEPWLRNCLQKFSSINRNISSIDFSKLSFWEDFSRKIFVTNSRILYEAIRAHSTPPWPSKLFLISEFLSKSFFLNQSERFSHWFQYSIWKIKIYIFTLTEYTEPFNPDSKSKFMTTSCWLLLKFVNCPDTHSNSLKSHAKSINEKKSTLNNLSNNWYLYSFSEVEKIDFPALYLSSFLKVNLSRTFYSSIQGFGDLG